MAEIIIFVERNRIDVDLKFGIEAHLSLMLIPTLHDVATR